MGCLYSQDSKQDIISDPTIQLLEHPEQFIYADDPREVIYIKREYSDLVTPFTQDDQFIYILY